MAPLDFRWYLKSACDLTKTNFLVDIKVLESTDSSLWWFKAVLWNIRRDIMMQIENHVFS